MSASRPARLVGGCGTHTSTYSRRLGTVLALDRTQAGPLLTVLTGWDESLCVFSGDGEKPRKQPQGCCVCGHHSKFAREAPFLELLASVTVAPFQGRSEEHTSELQSLTNL